MYRVKSGMFSLNNQLILGRYACLEEDVSISRIGRGVCALYVNKSGLYRKEQGSFRILVTDIKTN